MRSEKEDGRGNRWWGLQFQRFALNCNVIAYVYARQTLPNFFESLS